MVITMAKLRMAHASTHGARKPPGPKDRTMAITMAKLRMAHAWRTQARMAHASPLGQHLFTQMLYNAHRIWYLQDITISQSIDILKCKIVQSKISTKLVRLLQYGKLFLTTLAFHAQLRVAFHFSNILDHVPVTCWESKL